MVMISPYRCANWPIIFLYWCHKVLNCSKIMLWIYFLPLQCRLFWKISYNVRLIRSLFYPMNPLQQDPYVSMIHTYMLLLLIWIEAICIFFFFIQLETSFSYENILMVAKKILYSLNLRVLLNTTIVITGEYVSK